MGEARADAVPMTVLCGSMGSGKTTLLNRLVAAALERRERPAVLIGEMGTLPVDGAFVRQAHPRGAVQAYSVRWDATMAPARLAHAFARLTPTIGPFDSLLLELSGANPSARVRAALEAVLRRGALGPAVTGLRLIAVLDPGAGESVFARAASADAIVLNHQDRLSARERARARACVARVAGGAAVLEARFGKVELGGLPPVAWGCPPREPRPRCALPSGICRSFPLAWPMDASAVARTLARHAAGILRAKGVLWMPDGRAAFVQWSPHEVSVRRAACRDETPGLVVAGRCDWERLGEELRSCVAHDVIRN